MHRVPMLNVRAHQISLAALLAGFVACGGSTAAQSTSDGGNTGNGMDAGGSPQDAGAPEAALADSSAPKDAGADGSTVSTMYPPFPIDVAQVVNNGEAVLNAPVFVTVTWSSDPNEATFQKFGDQIGASQYWSTLNSEYGVGPATSGTANHVSIATAPPSSISDTDIDTLVDTNANNGTWPAPTRNTVYVVYVSPSSTFYFGGSPDAGGVDVCQTGVGGYHDQTSTHGTAYAVLPQCPMFQVSDVVLSASHEMNEAATDPYPGQQGNGYQGFDQNHLAWEFFNQFQDELGDACEMFSYAGMTTTEPNFSYAVQRQWSNKSARDGHDPCVPQAESPFVNTTFLVGDAGTTTQLDTITANLSALGMGAPSAVQSKGFKVGLNKSVTFPIGLFSDGSTKAPFNLEVWWPQQNVLAQDANGNNITNGTATVTLDKSSGVNGDIVNVTVTPTAYSTMGVTLFAIRAANAGSTVHHYLPVLLSQN